MAEILSQSEIDELLEQYQDGKLSRDVEVTEVATSADRAAIVYDFRHPNRVTRDQIRTLRVVHESFAKQVDSYLSTRLRALFSSKIEAIDQVTYAEFLLSLSDPSCVCVVGAEEFKSDFVVEISPSLAFLAIDRLFGGNGHPISEFREMSLIEQNVVRRMAEGLLRYYDQSWKPVYAIRSQLKTVHNRPSFAQVIAPGEAVVAISIGLSAGDISSAINVCLPYVLLEDVLPRTSAGKVAFGSTLEKTPEDRKLIGRRILDVPVSVKAQLGVASITLGDLLGLQIGDVLLLDTYTDDTVPIFIEGEHRADGRTGVRRKNLAVRLERLREAQE